MSMMSGFCLFPATERMTNGKVVPVSPEEAHGMCLLAGCPCACHLDAEEFECGNCGRDLRVAPWMADPANPDEPVYVHVVDSRSTGEEC
jgi:hypothetical protein